MKNSKQHSAFVAALAVFALIGLFLMTGCMRSIDGNPSAALANSAIGGDSEARFAQKSFERGYVDGNMGGFDGARRRANLSDVLSVQPGEELWVISRSDADSVAFERDMPRCGSLLATLLGAKKEVPLPLKRTDVDAAVEGYISTVTVAQQFHNPYSSKIEAKYVFPLPQNAAVNDFLMVIGERRIRGVIRERKEAERIYQNARSQGHVASLMTQERPNIFTQSVANIEPGRQIDIEITYFNTLAYKDGWYEFVFPMVVGPRFNPPGSSNGIGAVSKHSRGGSRQPTEVEYLEPNEKSAHTIGLQLRLNAGVAIEEMKSVNHRITSRQMAGEGKLIQLSRSEALPNKDFVLRYRVAGNRVKSSLITHQDHRGGFFTMMLYPPDQLKWQQRAPVEMIFVLDCSGSMRGQPMKQAKSAMRHALRQLGEHDSFQVIQFSNNSSQLGRAPLVANSANIKRGLKYVDQLDSGGGTMMIEGIRAALNFPHYPHRLRFVCFMTDGFIGNEVDILSEIQRNLGDSRVFSFGVGSSPNRYLMERMASVGRGAVAYLSLNDSGAKVMDDFFQRVSHPAMTDLRINWGGMHVTDVYPKRLPDLFVGRPVILTGRYSGSPSHSVRVEGRAGSMKIAADVPASSAQTGERSGLPSVWARMKIMELMNEATYGDGYGAEGAILRTALDYNLMSAVTAFVAVDGSRRTYGNQGTTVNQAVPTPDGVKYDTTVGN